MDELTIEQIKTVLYELNDRLGALEDTVNNTLIGGLKSAAATYKDNSAFDSFKGTYAGKFGDLVDRMKALAGDDYDVIRAVYDDLKGGEYGDEDVDGRIAALRERLDGAAPKVEIDVKSEEKDDEFPSEEQLAKELKEAE